MLCSKAATLNGIETHLNFMLQELNRLCLTSFFFLFTATAFIFDFCVVMPQDAIPWLVTCIVHATARTLRIFLLFIYSLQPATHKEQLGQQNQTYILISNFPVVLHSLAMHIVCPFHLFLRHRIFSMQSKILRLPCNGMVLDDHALVSFLILDYGHIGLNMIHQQRLFVDFLFIFF